MLSGVRNFRDVGGHLTAEGRRVRTGRLFRSGHLARAAEADLEQLERLGVRVVIDFRSPEEVSSEGDDRLPRGAELVSIPMYDLDPGRDISTLLFSTPAERIIEVFGDGRAAQAMTKATTAFVIDEVRAEQFALMVRTIIEADATVVIHCSAGKDRTGWAASLLLLLLGVPEATVISHYLESNLRRPEQHPYLTELERAGVDLSVLQPLVEVREEYKRSALDALAERWGGIGGYARDGLRLRDDEVVRFRAAMLEDPCP